jgi:hypothetical protein
VAPRPHTQVHAGAGEIHARLEPASWNVFVVEHGSG